MNAEEFREKVSKISDARGTVWVWVPLTYDPKDITMIRHDLEEKLNCRKCGKCCNGFWFNVTQLSLEDYNNILRAGVSEDEFDQITELIGGITAGLLQPCHFFKDNKCTIYKLRPTGCHWFPVIVANGLSINVSCPAGLDLYLDLVKEKNLELDSDGL